jgi:RNA polymerase sigma factor (sigma-70 family)
VGHGPDNDPTVSGRVERPLLDAYMAKRDDLIRYFAARLRSREAAEDLMQDLYLRLTALAVGETIDNPSAYLYRLASNLMLDRLRGERRAGARDDAWRLAHRTVFAGEEVMDEASPEQAVEARERLGRTIAAIKHLPPRTRRAFVLHKLQGLSQEETARTLGVSRKTVEKQISTALKQISAKLRRAER